MRLFDLLHPPTILLATSAASTTGAGSSAAGTGAAAGVATAAAAAAPPPTTAAAATRQLGGALKPFSLTEPLYDQSTFYGRLRGIMTQMDPFRMFTSRETIDRSVKLLDDYAAGRVGPDEVTHAELWEASHVKQSRCHPDTGEVIFLPLCFAAYMPMQPLIVMGMLWPGGGAANQAFWQWYNQSFNAAVVFANKNKSSEMSTTELVVAYCAAVGSALGISTGMRKLSQARPHNTFLRLGGPFSAVVFGGWASLVCMRQDELVQGVLMRDEHGNEHGMSKVAARHGIAKCCAARFLWSIPVLGISPFVLDAYYKTAFHAANPRVRLPVELAVATVFICIGLYPAQAVFSQTAAIDAGTLEPEFQGKVDPTSGEPVGTYFYNKGL